MNWRQLKSKIEEIQIYLRAVREDGPFIEAGENDICSKLVENPNAFGVFSFSLLENADKIQGSTVNGAAPTMAAITDKSYGISRPFIFM